MKEKLVKLRDIIVSNSKILFPVVLVAIVAVTVAIALGMNKGKNGAPESVQAAPVVISDSDAATGLIVPDVPFEVNAYPEVYTLICTYYDALGNGEPDRIAAISNAEMDDMKRIKIQELGKYIDSYTKVDIYTKPGPEENSYIVYAYTKAKFAGFDVEAAGYESFYVCTDANGGLYLNEGVVSQEYLDYILEVNFQDDVVEFCNKTTDEYNETMLANPDLFEYIAAMESDIRTATGLMLAAQEADNAVAVSEGDGQTAEGTEGGGQDQQIPDPAQTPDQTGPVYATTTATVNVRSSDSETADKLGKVSNGTKIEVLEQRANGWSKVSFEGKDGYIKSEYLQLAESAGGVESIGTVTATTNINIRAAANETAEKLGVLAGGESLELVANENGWCKVIYKGQIAYVKSDYVQ